MLAAAPDKAKQKQMEKSLEGFKKGRDLFGLPTTLKTTLEASSVATQGEILNHNG